MICIFWHRNKNVTDIISENVCKIVFYHFFGRYWYSGILKSFHFEYLYCRLLSNRNLLMIFIAISFSVCSLLITNLLLHKNMLLQNWKKMKIKNILFGALCAQYLYTCSYILLWFFKNMIKALFDVFHCDYNHYDYCDFCICWWFWWSRARWRVFKLLLSNKTLFIQSILFVQKIN